MKKVLIALLFSISLASGGLYSGDAFALPTYEETQHKREVITEMYNERYGEDPLQQEIHRLELYPEDKIAQHMEEVRQMRVDSDKRNKKK